MGYSLTATDARRFGSDRRAPLAIGDYRLPCIRRTLARILPVEPTRRPAAHIS
jgi:hypothetical protein